MNTRGIGFAVVLIFVTSSARAQPGTPARNTATPAIAGLFPPGAARGQTVDWTLTGRGFARVKQVIGLGKGVEVLAFEPVGETSARVTVQVARDAPLGYREIRVEGPDGISNLVTARIDHLPQANEIEPNDQFAQAQEIKPGTAIVGVLNATDVDHFRIVGKPGRRLTLDLEARRLGTAFSPVVTAMSASGVSLAQGRERPGGDRDCRLGVVVPDDGVVVVSIRDNVYGGAPLASYRFRVDPAPVASGLFPLGGPGGKTIDVEVAGGTLDKPIVKQVALPVATAPDFDLGRFASDRGEVDAPMRFVVGDADEVVETARTGADAALPIRVGQTMNGRIGTSGEVDRYRFAIKKGERLRFKIQAAELGSWLDSVVSVKDAAGNLLAENDDEGNAGGGMQGRRVNALGISEGSQDSVLEYTSDREGDLFVEVTDRYGDGGPEYAYRLVAGRSRPDFAVTLLIGNPNVNAGAVQQAAGGRIAPGLMGVFNLRQGSATPVNFLVTSEGSPGPLTITAEGLPPGVTVEPFKVDLGTPIKADSPSVRSVADNLVIRVSPYADPGYGEMRIVAKAQPKEGPAIVRYATGTVGIQQTNVGGQALPIMRSLTTFPLRVLGENRNRLVGPPPPPRLLKVTAPGVLLQGDRLDLQLEFNESPLAEPGFEFDAKAEGVGLATNTVVSSGESLGDEEAKPDVLVRVLASAKAEPGVYPVSVNAKYGGGRTDEASLLVIVRRPLQLLVRPGSLALRPGGSVEIPVIVRREPGCDGEIEIRAEDLPRGVKAAAPLTLAEGQSEGTLKLEMATGSRALRSPREIRILAIARMPRGAVTIESPIRPMIEPTPADQ